MYKVCCVRKDGLENKQKSSWVFVLMRLFLTGKEDIKYNQLSCSSIRFDSVCMDYHCR